MNLSKIELSPEVRQEIRGIMNKALFLAVAESDEIGIIRQHPCYLFNTLSRGEFRKYLSDTYPLGMEQHLEDDILPEFLRREFFEFAEDIKHRVQYLNELGEQKIFESKDNES